MNLYVSHMSALRYWRQFEGLSTSDASKVRVLKNPVCSTKDARLIMPAEHGLIMQPGHPLDVLVPSESARRYAKDLRPHVWAGEVPMGAFRKIGPNLFVSSPEFTYVQLALSFSVIELAQVGNELCGGYFLMAFSGFQTRLGKRPITSRRKIANMIDRVVEVRGAKRAREALRWVADHCDSPMETNTLLVLCLPKRLHGWSLCMPVMNKVIRVTERMRPFVGGELYKPDFYWERTVDGRILRITGEYDSSECHDADLDAEATRIRRNDMKAMGYLVTSINRSQMASANSMQYPARQIARDLGVYRRAPSLEMLSRQDELLRLLRRERFR